MDAQWNRLERALAGRYAVEHELGRGGMAVVYLGHDERLARRVAIKVFERAVSEQATERFLREIRVSARLQHPNIVPVFEAGEADGLVYYVMPYVPGGSLRERIEREGPLPVADAVRIGREIAEAIDHAHRAGIVHRDIKPDNIMLADGVAMVADFGIARALEDASEKVTGTGVAVGTPSYMSPEQGAGHNVIDGRTDIYALGCVLYEMLTGSPPFSGSTPQIVMARHATDPPPPLQTVRSVPLVLETAIQRAMAKLPADRWATAKELANTLALAAPSAMYPVPTPPMRHRWVAAVLVLIVMSASLAWALRHTGDARAEPPDVTRSVAVLPFELSGDTAQRDLADGLTEGVMTGLVQIPGISVPAESRVARYRDKKVHPRDAGRELKVSHVISGNVHVSGNRLRVIARLINVADGMVVWQGPFDGSLLANGQLRDLYAITDSMSVGIVSALRPRIEPDRRALAARGVRTTNREAFRLYQEAMRIPQFNTYPDSLTRRVGLLTEAVRLDSGFADAWAALAVAKQGEAMARGVPPIEAGPELRRLLGKALALDSMHAEALMLRGRYAWFFDWDWDGALHDVSRAARIAPGIGRITDQYFWLLTYTNQHDSALALIRARHDSTSPHSWWVLSQGYRYAGMPDSALAAAERGRQVNPDVFAPNMYLLTAYLRVGRQAAAESIATRFRDIALAGIPNVITILAAYYAKTGNRAGLHEMLNRIETLARSRYVAPSNLAEVRALAGDRDGAIAALEEAVRHRDNGLSQNFPYVYSHLKGDPRVEAIREKVYGHRPVLRIPEF